MGYMRHHSIAVTTWKDEMIKDLRSKAIQIFGIEMVTAIMTTTINEWHTFFVSPDGSKEGWGTSIANNDKRANFLNYIELMRYDDGSSPVNYCEYFYGDDDGNAEIVNHGGEPTETKKESK